MLALSPPNASPALVAYLERSGFRTEELRAGLRERLPEYMVPAAFVEVRVRRGLKKYFFFGLKKYKNPFLQTLEGQISGIDADFCNQHLTFSIFDFFEISIRFAFFCTAQTKKKKKVVTILVVLTT